MGAQPAAAQQPAGAQADPAQPAAAQQPAGAQADAAQPAAEQPDAAQAEAAHADAAQGLAAQAEVFAPHPCLCAFAGAAAIARPPDTANSAANFPTLFIPSTPLFA